MRARRAAHGTSLEAATPRRCEWNRGATAGAFRRHAGRRGGAFVRHRRALRALSARYASAMPGESKNAVAGPVLTLETNINNTPSLGPPSLFPAALRPCRLFLCSVFSSPCACSGSARAFLFFRGSASAACRDMKVLTWQTVCFDQVLTVLWRG